MLKELLLPGCDNSDGLLGFHFSHNGYWRRDQYIGSMGIQTKAECANTCLQNCIALTFSTLGHCYHYFKRSDLEDANKMKVSESGLNSPKAYVKCYGNH